MAKDKDTVELAPVKGRPMLQWVGKAAPSQARYHPPQLQESCLADDPAARPSYDAFRRAGHNLLFHGDNKEILSTLLVSGFRGQVDLIYIDPPFDSGVDYVRKVRLRGQSRDIKGTESSLIEEAQYTDIWASDTYLQFMYERLVLMRELLGDKGSIYVHCDENKSHHLRVLLDEVFGADNFRREIIWDITVLSGFKTVADNWIRGHDVIYYYSKSGQPIFNKQMLPHTDEYLSSFRSEDENGKYLVAHKKKRYLADVEKKGKPVGDVWGGGIIKSFQQTPTAGENVGYPTQKPESLLERIVSASSNPGSIVLDCFAGSGTTAVVSEKLGRRWIVADLNKGAIQTMMKRLQGVVTEKYGDNGDLVEGKRGFVHYRVNNYDFRAEKDLREVIARKYGVQGRGMRTFFDGQIDGNLVRIVDLAKPLSRDDLSHIKTEMTSRHPDETGDIVVICNGCTDETLNDIKRQNRTKGINRLIVRDIQRDATIVFSPPKADVAINKTGKTATVEIRDYTSPTILARMEIDRSVFSEQIGDFRAQIDCVLFDTDYDGKHFRIVERDLPAKKSEFVRGQYTLRLPRAKARVAVKIIDMLGEETLHVK